MSTDGPGERLGGHENPFMIPSSGDELLQLATLAAYRSFDVWKEIHRAEQRLTMGVIQDSFWEIDPRPTPEQVTSFLPSALGQASEAQVILAQICTTQTPETMEAQVHQAGYDVGDRYIDRIDDSAAALADIEIGRGTVDIDELDVADFISTYCVATVVARCRGVSIREVFERQDLSDQIIRSMYTPDLYARAIAFQLWPLHQDQIRTKLVQLIHRRTLRRQMSAEDALDWTAEELKSPRAHNMLTVQYARREIVVATIQTAIRDLIYRIWGGEALDSLPERSLRVLTLEHDIPYYRRLAEILSNGCLNAHADPLLIEQASHGIHTFRELLRVADQIGTDVPDPQQF
ncbi:MAG TPA: hypothetical protein VGS28_01005 [Candidatus Saccharimonadales bacterium]|nr:hypothetical protein [Candidatus Saccharimonadales bacterium]